MSVEWSLIPAYLFLIKKSGNIMTRFEKHLVIVGGNAAGLSAGRRARRNDSNLKITVLEKSNVVSYGACGLPYYISDVISQKEELIALPLEALLNDGIDVKTNHEVIEINPKNKTIVVKSATSSLQTVHYDKLVLATGARPLLPDLPGIDLEGVHTIRSLEGAAALKQELQSGRHKSAVIVGGGYIGLEMAEALTKQGVKVSVIEQQPQVLPYIDSEMAALVQQSLIEHGVTVKTSTTAQRILGDGSVSGVETHTGEVLNCSLVIVAIGVKPNVEIAQKAGIALGASGAIRVDDHLRTNVMNIYAAGDCTEVKNIVTNKYDYIPLGTTANKQGRVAGDNASGKRSRFPGVVGTSAVKVFNLEIGRAGITEKEASRLRLPVKSVTIKGRSRAGYFPGGSSVTVKLIFDFLTGRLLGAQMIGREGVAKRLDVFSTALQQKLTVQQISELDLSYAPPFAPVWDPILIAANQAQKQVINNW